VEPAGHEGDSAAGRPDLEAGVEVVVGAETQTQTCQSNPSQ